jgi:hypothetical protein
MGCPPDFVSQPGYSRKVLPDGVHPCDEATFHGRFVLSFPGNACRHAICKGLFSLRARAAALGVVGVQWVDGSFVEDKPDPGDVDVVTFCDYDFLNCLPRPAQDALVPLLNGQEAAKAEYHTHTFLVASCAPDHPYFQAFEPIRLYWRHWFGRTRETPNPPGPNLPGVPKGFVRIALGDPDQAPTISERGQP